MKFTIVTICYNAENTIEKTMCSVLSQTFDDYEYLIQDGASTDATVAKIDSVIDRYSELKDQIKVVSALDDGLYNAMNKAVERALGDYIIFMNSGDVFEDSEVLKKVASEMLKTDSADIFYGNVIRIKPAGEILEKYKGKKPLLKLLLTGNIPSHQSTFVKTEVMKEMRFDESYKITADFDFYVRAYSQKKMIVYMPDIIVSKVDNIEGVSSEADNLEKMRAEDDRSLRKNIPFWYYLIKIPKEIYRRLL